MGHKTLRDCFNNLLRPLILAFLSALPSSFWKQHSGPSQYFQRSHLVRQNIWGRVLRNLMPTAPEDLRNILIGYQTSKDHMPRRRHQFQKFIMS